jgi:GT2 family glycosyltransferase
VSNIALTTQKVVETLICHAQLNLHDYLSFPSAYQFMALSHVRNIQKGLQIPQIVLPYFCIKIPYSILLAVGLFDERYGQGGGEDYDYSLRALLAGFETRYAADSYIFHFGGKSSWDGPESAEEREVRENKFKQHFRGIWGSSLFNFVLHENIASLTELGITELNPAPGQLRNFLLRILQASSDKGEPLSKDWRH